jgi:hypothetical protein
MPQAVLGISRMKITGSPFEPRPEFRTAALTFSMSICFDSRLRLNQEHLDDGEMYKPV